MAPDIARYGSAVRAGYGNAQLVGGLLQSQVREKREVPKAAVDTPVPPCLVRPQVILPVQHDLLKRHHAQLPGERPGRVQGSPAPSEPVNKASEGAEEEVAGAGEEEEDVILEGGGKKVEVGFEGEKKKEEERDVVAR